MKLILSDKYLNLDVSDHSNTKFIDLSSLNIATALDALAVGLRHRGNVLYVTMQQKYIRTLPRVII